MSIAPSPEEIYHRAQDEGRRRLSMSALEITSTSFIAGVTIVFGIVALGVVEGLVVADLGAGVASLLGALAFGVGLVFLIVSRTELFTENFFDPVAWAIHERTGRIWWRLVRYWTGVLLLNLVGGAVLVWVATVDGALPDEAHDALDRVAEDLADKTWTATLARAILAGTVLTILSYMLSAVDTVAARILVAYPVGVLLATGPFDHVVVTALHLLAGVWLGADVDYGDVGANIGLAAAGNLLGGLVLITLTHTAQVAGRGGGDGGDRTG